MKTNIQTSLATLATTTLLSAFGLSACDMGPDYGSFPSADDELSAVVSKDEAIEIAEVAFSGINTSDYEKWSTRWDAKLLEGIPEMAWRQLNAELISQVGLFEDILEVRMNAAETPGYVRFSFLVQFERALVMYVHVYPVDGSRIVGIFARDPYAAE